MVKRNHKIDIDNQVTNWSILLFFTILVTGFVSEKVSNVYDSSIYEIQTAYAAVPNLALSPSSAVVSNNQTFTANILLDTAGSAADGVDIYRVRFNPAILQVVDDNTSLTGVQITPGTLFPNTSINLADNTAGTIQFSQAASGGTNFNGSGILAIIHFRSIASGTSSVSFDFTAGSTADCNISFYNSTSGTASDILAQVTNASFTVDTTAPTVSITSPVNGSSVSGTITVSANASDNVGVAGVQFKVDGSNLGAEDTSSPYSTSFNTSTVGNGSHTLTAVARDGIGNSTTSSIITITVNNADVTPPSVSMTAPSSGSTVSGTTTVSATASDNIGVVGVQFKLDGVNLGVEDTTSPYSISWNSTTATNASHTLTAVARDAAGNTTTSSGVSVTVNNAYNRTIQLDLEGRTSDAVSGTLSVLNLSKNLIKTYPYSTSSTGNATISFDITPLPVYLKVNPVPFLARLLNVDLNNNSTYTFTRLMIGDLNQDNIINSVDYSVLNGDWFTNDPVSDLNADGIVNSIDFSYMNQHWLMVGES